MDKAEFCCLFVFNIFGDPTELTQYSELALQFLTREHFGHMPKGPCPSWPSLLRVHYWPESKLLQCLGTTEFCLWDYWSGVVSTQEFIIRCLYICMHLKFSIASSKIESAASIDHSSQQQTCTCSKQQQNVHSSEMRIEYYPG